MMQTVWILWLPPSNVSYIMQITGIYPYALKGRDHQVGVDDLVGVWITVVSVVIDVCGRRTWC